jgi:hypothetical protein
MNPTPIASLAALALAAAACAGGPAGDPSIPDPLPLEGRTYVIDSIEVGGTAAEAGLIAVDIDGDDRPENAFGTSLSVAESVLDVDLDAEIAAALAGGELLHLLMFASDESGAALDTGRLFLGADTDGEPANNFTGDADLAIRGDSSLDDAAFGSITQRQVDLEGGAITVENVLFAPIRMPLIGARIAGTFDELGGFTGTIAGGIDAPDLDRLRLGIAAAIAAEANAMCDPDQIPCCPEDSRGEVYMTYLDRDYDCQLAAGEVAANDILRWLTVPDMDLDSDGQADAMSVGFRVTAVPAHFEIPGRSGR